MRQSRIRLVVTLLVLVPVWATAVEALAQAGGEKMPTKLQTERLGKITDLAFSRDGKFLAAGGITFNKLPQKPVVNVWDLQTGKVAAILEDRVHYVQFVALSPNGKLVAGLNADNDVQVWEAATQKLVATFKDSEGPVTHLEFSADGKFLAAPNSQGMGKLWDLASGKERADLPNPVAFSPDARLVATTRWRPTRLLDVASGKVHATLTGEINSSLCSAAFSPDKLAALGDHNGNLELWDTVTGKRQALLRKAEKRTRSIARQPLLVFSADGRSLAEADNGGAEEEVKDRSVTVWDVAAGKPRAVVKLGPGWLASIHLSRDGTVLMARSSFHHRLTVWDVAKDKQLLNLTKVPAMALAPTGNILAVADGQGMVQLHDLDRLKGPDKGN